MSKNVFSLRILELWQNWLCFYKLTSRRRFAHLFVAVNTQKWLQCKASFLAASLNTIWLQILKFTNAFYHKQRWLHVLWSAHHHFVHSCDSERNVNCVFRNVLTQLHYCFTCYNAVTFIVFMTFVCIWLSTVIIAFIAFRSRAVKNRPSVQKCYWFLLTPVTLHKLFNSRAIFRITRPS